MRAPAPAAAVVRPALLLPSDCRFDLTSELGKAKFIAWLQPQVDTMHMKYVKEEEAASAREQGGQRSGLRQDKVWLHISAKSDKRWNLQLYLPKCVHLPYESYDEKVQRRIDDLLRKDLKLLYPSRYALGIELKFPEYGGRTKAKDVARENSAHLLSFVNALFSDWKAQQLPAAFQDSTLHFPEEEHSTDMSTTANIFVLETLVEDVDLVVPTEEITSDSGDGSDVILPGRAADLFQSKSFQDMWIAIQALLPQSKSYISWHMGPSPDQRQHLWRSSHEKRLRLANHLLKQPHILMDVETDPAVPWKSQRFFHGTSWSLLQSTRTLTPGDFKDHDSIQKLIVDGTLKPNCQLRPKNSFTTPYYTKALEYGEYGQITYTYKLSVDGRQLRMIDLRGDKVRTHTWSEGRLKSYVKTRGDKEQSDREELITHPVNLIHQLSGIAYNDGGNRVQKAADFVRFFEGTKVDGAILNSDVEWIWMRPSEVLEWVHPNKNTDWLSWCLFNHTLEKKKDMLAERIKQDITVDRIVAFLQSAHVKHDKLSDLTSFKTRRWRFNSKSKHTSQFEVDESGAAADQSSTGHVLASSTEAAAFEQESLDKTGFHWIIQTGVSHEGNRGRAGAAAAAATASDIAARQKDEVWTVLRCDYLDFWNAVAPWFLHCCMGMSVTEGNRSLSAFLGGVQPQLKSALRLLRSDPSATDEIFVISMTLPSQSRQLLPALPFNLDADDDRLY